ncbi:hydroxypyruvate isomerase family protein [Paenibacillus sp. CF384]|uniref:hydroxypyruvate isomerase family protein n=1 Tax=Paenibacillus sp. CF384 TaxID=1884382 RepID=UPI0008964597|nr:TIM barrel protein [Paenibacillus sp. CF384]SDX62611.1 hydroxypyruvate isomerase [Paenibacillus sp. CF384]
MKLSVCLDALYNGKDFFASLEEVRAIGYDTVEFWSWWDKDVERLAQLASDYNMTIASMCVKSANLVDESLREAYLEGLRESIAAAKQLNCRTLILTVGQELADVSREVQQQSIIDGLRASAPLVEEAGITIVLEPLNTLVDHKGYYLSSSEQAFDIIRQVGSTNVKLVFDIYHQQIMEGNLLANILPNLELIGHFHAAGNPGRHELSSGELHYGRIFDAIDAAGYEGYMGLEYFPIAAPEVGLKELLAEVSV